MSTNASESALRSAPYEFFILGLSLYVLIALAIDTLAPIDEASRAILRQADFAICFFFLADFIRSAVAAPNRRRYLLTWGWVDLLSSIPTLSIARWGRAARAIRIVRILRGFRSVRNLASFVLRHRAQAAFSAAALVSILLVVFSSIAILQFEAGAEGANILTPHDAMWWAYVTITTVGYGDFFPVTFEGRVIAGILMTAGVGLFGTFTGFVATWFLAPGHVQEEGELELLRRDIRELRLAVIGGRSETS